MLRKALLSVIALACVLIVAIGGIVLFPPTSALSSASPGKDNTHFGTTEAAEYAVRLGDCVACHSVPGGKPFAGGLAMGSPLGTIYTTNITPDVTTGIGGYSLADFDNAVRHGIAKDGHRLYPAMPYPSYAKLSDDDLKLLYQYFMESVPAVEQANRAPDIKPPYNTRWPLALWNIAFTDSKPYATDASRDAKWNRGAYLVQGAGHCGSCHTPRGGAFQELALSERGDSYLSGALLDGWKASSLRGETNVGLGRWSEEDIAAFLVNGHNDHASVYGSMMDAFNNSTQYLTADDASAIAHYLKSLPAFKDSGPAFTPDGATEAMLKTFDQKPLGPQQYLKNCVFCHGRDGKGLGYQLSALAGNPSILDPDPSSVINMILNGAGRVVRGEVPDTYRMFPFRGQMTDDEIAAVASFIRSGWGNRVAPAVTASQVSDLRGKTDPASDRVIILRMR